MSVEMYVLRFLYKLMSAHAREFLTFNNDRNTHWQEHEGLRELVQELEEFTCKENKRDWTDSMSQLDNLNHVLRSIYM